MVTSNIPRGSIVFKVLGAPQRLQVMQLLLGSDRALCGSELAQQMGLPLYAVSRHLKLIHAAGLVAERREGRRIYYSPQQHRDAVFLRAIHAAVTALECARPLVTSAHA